MTPDNRTPDTTTVHDLAGAYALHALPADEVEAFEAHLASCRDCTLEVASMRDVTTNLAVLAAEAPPPEVRSSVLAAITSVRQVPRSTSAEPVETGPATRDVVTASTAGPDRTMARPDNVVSLDDHRRLRRSARAVTGIAAALVLVAGGVGLWANSVNDQLRGRDQAIAQVASVLNAPDAQLQNVGGSSLVLSPSQQQAVFAAGRLAPSDSASVLQLWVIDDDGIRSAGVVEDTAEPAVLDIPVPSGARVGVTVEPAGGSDQPTTEPVVVFET